MAKSYALLFFALTAWMAEQGNDTKNFADGIPDSSNVQMSSIKIGESFSFSSDVYGAKREVNIWTPPEYESNEKKYSVLYIIDGGLEQDFHHISGLVQLASINGDYEELIVVGIKTENRLMELAHAPRDPRYVKDPPDAGKSDQFLRFISSEVIPFVESRFRTNDRKAVIGESLAGLFITEVFLKSPQTFTDFIAISPSLWWDDRALAKSAKTLVKSHNGDKRTIYFSMADEGGTMQSGLDLVLDAINQNKPQGLSVHYVDRRNSETHSTIYHGAAHDALRMLFDVPAPEYSQIPWYLIEGGQPPARDDSNEKN